MARQTLDQWALSLAIKTAERSTCLRRNVGCVLLNQRGHVLATGYNGVAVGLPHCNEEALGSLVSKPDGLKTHPNACEGATAPSGTQLDLCQAIHAEQNALLQCRDVWEIHACYVTVSPCTTCVKLLRNTSCKRIVFLEKYAHDEAASRLWKSPTRTWEHALCL